MKAWINEAAVELCKAYGEKAKEVSAIAFADLSEVPWLLQFGVSAFLGSTISSDHANLRSLLEEAGLAADLVRPYELVADWDGSFKAKLGVVSSDQYTLFVVFDGKVSAVLREGDGSPDEVKAKYLLAMRSALDQV
mmetsp:Transcript_36207/g.102033  ORF Transcript_36207/g.102033 Transcript_36207/m.102033 type:complete len:136 (+) Transcript_36207:77-484(+)